MNESLLVALTSALVAGSLPAWWNWRIALGTERRTARRMAATGLVEPLGQMRRLLRAYGRVPVDRREVAACIADWDRAWDRHRHLLPSRWRFLNRSVRAAFATVFGAVALADTHPHLRDGELPEPDHRWQEFGDEYLGYASDMILRWGETRAPSNPDDFDTWLRVTERHDPVALGWASTRVSG